MMLTIPPLHVCVLTELWTELDTSPLPSSPSSSSSCSVLPALSCPTLTIMGRRTQSELAVKIFLRTNICGGWRRRYGAERSKQCYVTMDSYSDSVTVIISFIIGYFPGGQELAVTLLLLYILQNTNVLVLQTLRPGIKYIYCVIKAVQGCNTLRENMDPIHLCLVKI